MILPNDLVYQTWYVKGFRDFDGIPNWSIFNRICTHYLNYKNALYDGVNLKIGWIHGLGYLGSQYPSQE